MADKQHIRARLKRREIEPIFLWIDTATIHSCSLSDLEEDYQWIVDALHNTLTIHPTAALFVSDQSVYRLLYSFLKIKLPHVILPKPDMHLSASFLFDYVEYDRYGLLDLCMCHLN
jgi:hypothetical protein